MTKPFYLCLIVMGLGVLPHAARASSTTTVVAATDGTTDDTAVIQAAINTLPPTGGTLYFPAGTYAFCHVAITVPITIYGDGSKLTNFTRTCIGSYADMIDITTTGAVTLHDFGIDHMEDGSESQNGNTIVITSSTLVNVNSIYVAHSPNVGLAIDYASNVTVTSSTFYQNWWMGVSAGNGTGGTAAPVYFHNYNFHGNTYIDEPIGLIVNFFMSDITVSSETFTKSNLTIMQTPHANITIRDITIDGTPDYGCTTACGLPGVQNGIYMEGVGYADLGNIKISNYKNTALGAIQGSMMCQGSKLQIPEPTGAILDLPCNNIAVHDVTVDNADGFSIAIAGQSNGPHPTLGFNDSIKNTTVTNSNGCQVATSINGFEESGNVCENIHNGGYSLGEILNGSFHNNIGHNIGTNSPGSWPGLLINGSGAQKSQNIDVYDNQFTEDSGYSFYFCFWDATLGGGDASQVRHYNNTCVGTTVPWYPPPAIPTVGAWTAGNLIQSNPNGSGILDWECSASGTPGTWQTITVNQPQPTANGTSVVTAFQTPIDLILSGSDPNNLPLTFSTTTLPMHGTLSGTAPYLLYTPAAGYSGTDSFSFTANNGGTTSSPAGVSITVGGTPVPPSSAKEIFLIQNTPDQLTHAVLDSFATYHINGFTVEGTYNGVSDTFLNGGVSRRTPADDQAVVTQMQQILAYSKSKGMDRFFWRILANDTWNIYNPTQVQQMVATFTNEAQFAKNVGLTGLILDMEPYNFNLWNQIADPTKQASSHTQAQVDQQYFNVGKQVMQAIIAVYPNIQLFVLPGTKDDEANYHDYFHFYAGMIAADLNNPQSTGIINMTEIGYYVADPFLINCNYQFAQGYVGNTCFTGPSATNPYTYMMTVLQSYDSQNGNTAMWDYWQKKGDTAIGQWPMSAGAPLPLLSSLDTYKSAVLDTYNLASYNAVPAHPRYLWTYDEGGSWLLGLTNSAYTYPSCSAYTSNWPANLPCQGYLLSQILPPLSPSPAPPPPTANAQSLTTAFNTPLGIVLSGTDPDGPPLTYSTTTLPMHGVLSGAGPNLTYTPSTGYAGPDSFSFTVNNGFVTSSTVTISLVVNTPPIIPPPAPPLENGSSCAQINSPTLLSDVGAASFSAACASAVSANATLSVTQPWLSVPTMTCAANLIFNGGQIQPASGQTVTFTGNVSAPSVQIFDYSSGGKVVFNGPPAKVDPHWWGATGAGQSHDDGPAIQAAINALPKGGTVLFPNSANPYVAGVGIILYNNITIAGESQNVVIQKLGGPWQNANCTDPGCGAIFYTSITAPPVSNAWIKNITLDGNRANITGLTGDGGHDGVTFLGASDSGVDNAIVKNAYTGGIEVACWAPPQTAGNNITIRNTVITGSRRNNLEAVCGTNTHMIGGEASFAGGGSLCTGADIEPNTGVPEQLVNGFQMVNVNVHDNRDGGVLLQAKYDVAPSYAIVNGNVHDNGNAGLSAVNYSVGTGLTNDGTLSVVGGTYVNNAGATAMNFAGWKLVSVAGETNYGSPRGLLVSANVANVILGPGTLSGTYQDPGSGTFYDLSVYGPYSSATLAGVTLTHGGVDPFSIPGAVLRASPGTFPATLPPPPHAGAQTLATAFNTATSVTLAGADPNGYPLSFEVSSAPLHGILSGMAPNLLYTPAYNYVGLDSFTFVTWSSYGISVPSTVSITVGPPAAPSIAAQSFTTAFNTPIAIVLKSTDPDGLFLTYSTTTVPTHGTLSGTAPNLTYTPAGGYSGTDSFSFISNNGCLASPPVTVSITVNASAATAPPLANPDLSSIYGKTFTANETLTIPYTGALTGFNWVFAPMAPQASALRSPLASLPQGSPAPISTASSQLSIGRIGLAGGSYLISVQAVDGTQTSDWVSAPITYVTAVDLNSIRVYPNPFRAARGDSQMTFDQMPRNSTVKIFTVGARLVKTLNAPAGLVSWDLTNDSGEKVASGVYLYLISDSQGNKKYGKFTVIR